MILPKVKIGGVIFIDNILWYGKIYNEEVLYNLIIIFFLIIYYIFKMVISYNFNKYRISNKNIDLVILSYGSKFYCLVFDEHKLNT